MITMILKNLIFLKIGFCLFINMIYQFLIFEIGFYLIFRSLISLSVFIFFINWNNWLWIQRIGNVWRLTSCSHKTNFTYLSKSMQILSLYQFLLLRHNECSTHFLLKNLSRKKVLILSLNIKLTKSFLFIFIRIWIKILLIVQNSWRWLTAILRSLFIAV